jgi:hypothetical protein
MVTQTLALKRFFGALLVVLLFVQSAAAHKAANQVTQSKKGITQAHNSRSSPSGPGYLPVIRDFDKLRVFQSYDPATNKWSAVEDFETVDILEETTMRREDRYIYRSFWAYDVEKACWHKVDIRDYGYKLGKMAATARSEETPEAAPQKSSGFWENWTLGLRAGAGPTWYTNKLAHCIVKERDGAFFLQTEQGDQDKKSYKINWFGAGYTAHGDPLAGSQGALGIGQVKTDDKIVFKGTGWNIPITLFTHYTFFNRFRLGAGCTLEVNHLKELIPKGDTSYLQPFKIPLDYQWFYNIGWFGLLGFKVIHEPHQDIVVDLQLGRNYNTGATLKNIFGKTGHFYDGWLLGVGVAYERKLSDHFRLLTRVSGDYKIHDDTPSGIGNSRASIKLNQLVLHLDLGIQVSFGKNTKEKDAKTEELGINHDTAAEDRARSKSNQSKAASGKISNTKNRHKRPR